MCQVLAGYDEKKARDAANQGGLGPLTLSELNRRGLLLPPPPSPQDLQRGKASVSQELDMRMSVFKLEVGPSIFQFVFRCFQSAASCKSIRAISFER